MLTGGLKYIFIPVPKCLDESLLRASELFQGVFGKHFFGIASPNESYTYMHYKVRVHSTAAA